MTFGCVFHPFRRGIRRCKKSIIAPPQPPRCPACLDQCLPPTYSPPEDEGGHHPVRSSEAPITIPCTQTYHAECLRELFALALASGHPPRCCGSFIPLSTLFRLYPDPQPAGTTTTTTTTTITEDTTPPKTTESPITEKPKAAKEAPTAPSASPTPTPALENKELANKLTAFRLATSNPVDCVHCKRWVLPEDINEDLETAVCNPSHGGCGGKTCVVCRGEAHPQPPAPAVEPNSRKARKAMRKLGVGCTKVSEKERVEIRFKRLVGREGWRPCGKCGWMLSRDTGCCEVVCRCGNYETLRF
ncbi:hypothetical protein K440DRAFT_192598 [Wilcoxina mikolae CBS 423.85]|nr:hypothetical protein K440DRAFT_192598 [Wilcoxina mikolae CBS 423.85]